MSANEDWELELDEWQIVTDRRLTFDCGCIADCGTTMYVEHDGKTQMITLSSAFGDKVSFILPDNLLLVRKAE